MSAESEASRDMQRLADGAAARFDADGAKRGMRSTVSSTDHANAWRMIASLHGFVAHLMERADR